MTDTTIEKINEQIADTKEAMNAYQKAMDIYASHHLDYESFKTVHELLKERLETLEWVLRVEKEVRA